MSLVRKSPEPDKQRNGVYLLLDGFIQSEKMLRRLFSYRRTKVEEKEGESASSEETQKENVDPNTQAQDVLKKAYAGTVTQDKLVTPKTEPKLETVQLDPSKELKPNNGSNWNEENGQDTSSRETEEQVIPESCLALERTILPTSDAESEVKECEGIKGDVSHSDEFERCESSTSAEESSKDESGIEQDFESAEDSSASPKPEDCVLDIDAKEKFSRPENTPESLPLPLIPINLKSHLKRNERIKKFDRISKRAVVGRKEPISTRGYESSPEKCPSFISGTRRDASVHRVRYSQRLPVVTPIRQPRRNKVPEMFGDLIVKDPRVKSRSHLRSPVRKGILKNAGGSKFVTPGGTKFASTPKKQKAITSKGHRADLLSSDSGLSESDASSGEEQKRMPVRKIFSNQQALRRKIDDLNGMLKNMQEQKSELQAVLGIIEDWSEALRHVDRTNLGVPYIRAVKQLLAKQRTALGSRKSDINRRVTNLKESEVPYLEEFCNLILQLKKEVTYVVRDQRKYSVRSVENIRQLQGKLIGTCTAILAVYYEQ